MSLLSLAVDRRFIGGSALAFGKDGVKKRIKNVLRFRKSSRIAVVLAVAFVTVLSLGLLVSRTGTDDSFEPQTIKPEPMNTGVENVSTSIDSFETDYKDGSDYIDASGGTNMERLYTITDYYNERGKFSALGLTLDEKNSERMLAVSGGDILIAGSRQYEVKAELLTLSFYTQPSLDQVVQWWADYLDSWAESGKVTAIS
jgi:hypothetical protein